MWRCATSRVFVGSASAGPAAQSGVIARMSAGKPWIARGRNARCGDLARDQAPRYLLTRAGAMARRVLHAAPTMQPPNQPGAPGPASVPQYGTQPADVDAAFDAMRVEPTRA